MPVPLPPVGATARRVRRVGSQDIERFPDLTGDRDPVHYDPEVAAASRFGAIIVQGGVTSGLLNAVVAEDLPGPGSVFVETHWRYLASVHPGDELTAEVEVLESRAGKPVWRLRTTITSDRDGATVLDGTAVVWRDPAVAARTHPTSGVA